MWQTGEENRYSLLHRALSLICAWLTLSNYDRIAQALTHSAAKNNNKLAKHTSFMRIQHMAMAYACTAAHKHRNE